MSRGFDYAAAAREIPVRAGERVEVTFALRRRTPLRRLGWVCGDSHDHMIHDQAAFPVSFDYAALAARAEGLDYMSLAQYWNSPESTPARLEQACQAAGTDDFQMTWNMEMPKNYWRGDVAHCVGHGWTLAMKGYTADGRDAIRELFQMNAWDYESDKIPTPNFDSHSLIHSLGGIACYSHPLRFHYGPWGGKGIYPFEEKKPLSNMAAELPFDTIAGPTYDGIDVITGVNHDAQQLWFLLLNHGYRLAGTASSDAAFANPGGAVPGKARMYTRLPGAFSIAGVADAMKQGRNLATNGPLLLFEIGASQVGDVIRVDRAVPRKGSVRAWASGAAGQYLTRVEILRNGEVVRNFPLSGQKTAFEAEFDVSEAKTSWYVARAAGSSADQIALTNPIYFEAADYRAPQATAARVTATVVDQHTGNPLDGTAQIVTMVGRTAVKGQEIDFTDGKFTLEMPGTARILVKAAGHAPVMKSVFMNFEPLLNLILNMTPGQLLDWGTYEKIRSLLRRVQLDFRLPKQDHPD